MSEDIFSSIMPVICAELVGMISEKQNLPEEKAIEILYSSKLYAALENEDTKVWQYSTPMLYSLFENETNTGKIEFPDT